MSRYDDFYYPPYVSVAEKKERNAKMAAKMAKKNQHLALVILKGNKIASTFWGKAWCDNVESYRDYENRLPRGRSYVRSGAVIDLQITSGHVAALVAGSANTPYKITLDIKPLAKTKWTALKAKCVGKISSLLALAQGKLPPEILEEFCNRESGLFPSPREIKTTCSCPDWAGLCKHLAAVFYGIGARLDENPRLFFTLRGIDENELIGTDVVTTLTGGVNSEIASDNLANVFGMEFDELPESVPEKIMPIPPAPAAKNAKRKRVKIETPPFTHDVPAVSNRIEHLREVKARNEQDWQRVLSSPSVQSTWRPEEIRALRKRLNLTQAAFGKLCATSPATVSQWENGRTRISEFFCPALATISRRDSEKKTETQPKKVPSRPVLRKKWTAGMISRLRKKLGLSQMEFGKRLEISGQTVGNWEKGNTTVKEVYWKKLNEMMS